MISPGVKEDGLQLLHLLRWFRDFFEKIGYLSSFFSGVGWPYIRRAAKEIKLWYTFTNFFTPFVLAIDKRVAEYVLMLRV